MVEDFIVSCKNAYETVANNLMQILAGILIFLVFLLISKRLEKIAVAIISRFFKGKESVKQAVVDALSGPSKAYFRMLGAYFGFSIVGLPDKVFSPIHTLFRIGTILIIAWIFADFMPFVTSLIIKSNQRTNKKSNTVAVTFLANILKVIVFTIAGVIVISELGYNINGLIAGVGLGGLTFSLAAKETATNIFGGFAIITDKPFDVGDRITTPSVDGVVEDITMRSTRIRTVADTVIIVPNSTLIADPITNWSRMKKRRVDFKIRLTYDTSVKTLRTVLDKIEKMLKEHPDVHKNGIVVCFEEFSESSLDIHIMYFIKTTDYSKSIAIREDINMNIKKIVDAEKTAFALPSSSVYINNVNN